MSFNGSGTFTISTAGQPVVTGTVIDSVAFNALTADLATGLSTTITKDGQTTPTANIPLGTYKLTGVGAATARTDAASLANIQDGTGVYVGTVGGTADVITLTVSPAITAYAAGQTFRFIGSGANTTNVTVNISSLGAKAITKNGTVALAAGDIPSAAMVTITYDGTRFILGDPLLGSFTSAQLLAALTDETGTGLAVFGTSPGITTSLTTPSTSFALVNTTATTVNFAGGASTAVNIGNASGTNTVLGATTFSQNITLSGTGNTVGTITTGVWTGTDIAVADGGTGRSTGTTAYALVAVGTTATGAQQTLASGATTELLVGGGASALPVWTTATGTGAPARAGSPTFTGTLAGAAASFSSTLAAGATTITGALSATGTISYSNASASILTGFKLQNTTANWNAAIDSYAEAGSGLYFNHRIRNAIPSHNNGGIVFETAVAGVMTEQGRFTTTGLAVTGTLSADAAAGGFSGLQVGTGSGVNAGLIIGNSSSGIAGIWSTAVTPAGTNYAFLATATVSIVNAVTTVAQRIGNSTVTSVSSTGLAVTGALSATGTINSLSFNQFIAGITTATIFTATDGGDGRSWLVFVTEGASGTDATCIFSLGEGLATAVQTTIRNSSANTTFGISGTSLQIINGAGDRTFKIRAIQLG